MQNQLSTWQAACIITGYGVGSGIMSLPYLMSRAGLICGLLIVLASFLFCYILHTMLAEICVSSGSNGQIVSSFQRFLFRGKYGKYLLIILFVLVVIMLLTNLAAYIAGGAEVLESLGVPAIAAKLIFYAAAAGVVFFGLKFLGASESVTVCGIIAIVALLAFASLAHLNNNILFPTGSLNEGLAFFGMSMFAFIAFFSIPQVCTGLGNDPVKIRKAILLGLAMNLGFILVICLCSLASSAEISSIAIIGWSQGIGTWAQIIGSIFTVMAMLSTYWSISLALSDIIQEQMHWSPKLCWLLATLPSLLLVLFNLGGFLELMRSAAGVMAILIALLVPLGFRRARKEANKPLLPAIFSGSAVQIIVLIAFILMAVGSAVAI